VTLSDRGGCRWLRLPDRGNLRAAQRRERDLRVARSGLEQPRCGYPPPPLLPLITSLQGRSALCGLLP